MRTAVLTLCALMPAGGQEIFVRRRNLCQRSRGRSYTQTNRHQISSRPSIIEINYNESPIKWPCADTTTSCIRPRCASSWPSMYRSRQPCDLKLIGIVCTNSDGYVFEVRHVHSHASPISTLYQSTRARSQYFPISHIFLLIQVDQARC